MEKFALTRAFLNIGETQEKIPTEAWQKERRSFRSLPNLGRKFGGLGTVMEVSCVAVISGGFTDRSSKERMS